MFRYQSHILSFNYAVKDNLSKLLMLNFQFLILLFPQFCYKQKQSKLVIIYYQSQTSIYICCRYHFFFLFRNPTKQKNNCIYKHGNDSEAALYPSREFDWLGKIQ